MKGGKRSLVWTRFSVVVKVAHYANQNPEFEITNRAECELARWLTRGNGIEDRGGKCVVTKSTPYVDRTVGPISRIARLTLPDFRNPIPQYLNLTCLSQAQ